MKLVLEYQWGGEPRSGTTTLTFNHDSLESAYCELDDKIQEAIENESYSILFCNKEYSVNELMDFINNRWFESFSLYTLDSWFDRNCINPEV